MTPPVPRAHRSNTEVSLRHRYSDVALAVAAHGLDVSSNGFPSEPVSEDGWPDLLGVVRKDRLGGLLAAAAQDGAFAGTPEQLADVQSLHTSTMVWSLRLEHGLVGVVDQLATAGLDAVVLKGTAVAHLDYPNSASRCFGDLDLLVRSEDVDRAVRLLGDDGYEREFAEPRPGFDRRFGKGATFRSPRGFDVDLHRTFVDGFWGQRIGLDDVWRNTTEFSVAGRPFRALSDPIRFLHACFHAALGNWPPRLGSVRDVAQMALAHGVDNRAIIELAERWRCEPVIAVAITDAWDLLGIVDDTPLSSWARSVTLRRAESARLAVYRRDTTGYPARALSTIAGLSGTADRVAYIRALVSPAPGFSEGRHTSSAGRLWHAARTTRPQRKVM